MRSLLHVLRGGLLLLLLTLNLFFWGTPLLAVSLVKIVLPTDPLRRRVMPLLIAFADLWSLTNRRITRLLLPTRLVITGEVPVEPRGHFLLLSNHRSWVDILVLGEVFTGRLPFIRFFLKRELIWVPVVGAAAWALEFPFMKRYTPEYLADHPEKRGQDLETTRRACERYRHTPVTVLNFLEGTRWSAEKAAEARSPYRHLLRPRTGGVAHVLATLGPQLDGVYDVTLAYPGEPVTLWRWVRGEVTVIDVHVRRIDVPREFFSDTVTEPGPERDRFKEWLASLWREKDDLLDELLQSRSADSSPDPAG